MKNCFKYNIIIAILLSVILSGCKLETSHNGKLDGYWKLKTIDNIATEEVTDLSEESIFWSVQKDLLEVRDNGKEGIAYIFRFIKTDDTLTLKDVRRSKKEEGDPVEEDLTKLNIFGIYSQPETFKIDNLSSRVMTLSTEDIRLHFRKF